jgi:hypothetical protein
MRANKIRVGQFAITAQWSRRWRKRLEAVLSDFGRIRLLVSRRAEEIAIDHSLVATDFLRSQLADQRLVRGSEIDFEHIAICRE